MDDILRKKLGNVRSKHAAPERRGPKIRTEPKSEAVRVVLTYIRCALATGRPMRGLQTEAAEVAGVSRPRANQIWKRWGGVA